MVNTSCVPIGSCVNCSFSKAWDEVMLLYYTLVVTCSTSRVVVDFEVTWRWLYRNYPSIMITPHDCLFMEYGDVMILTNYCGSYRHLIHMSPPLLQNAPHTMSLVTANEWHLPYPREKAAFPLVRSLGLDRSILVVPVKGGRQSRGSHQVAGGNGYIEALPPCEDSCI